MFDASRRVHFLGHDQWLGLEIKGNRRVGAGCCARSFYLAPGRLDAGDRVDHCFQVFWSCAATSANDSDAVIYDEMLVILGQILRLKFVYCVPTFIEWKAGIGQNGD